MEVITFSPQEAKEIVRELLELRGLDSSWADQLPATGILVRDSEGQAIAAGFIRKAEGGVGILDSYITNPKVIASARDAALDVLTEALIAHAQASGIMLLLAITKDNYTQLRSERHGFKRLAEVTLAMTLKQGER